MALKCNILHGSIEFGLDCVLKCFTCHSVASNCMPRPIRILWHAFNELHRSSSKAILRALEKDRDKQVTMQRTEWRMENEENQEASRGNRKW